MPYKGHIFISQKERGDTKGHDMAHRDMLKPTWKMKI